MRIVVAIWTAAILFLAAYGHGADGASSSIVLEDVNRDGRIVVLAFGDSITRGMGDGPRPGDTPPRTAGYPLRLQKKLLGVTVVNAGISGERTGEGLARLASTLTSSRADYAILLEGTNDLFVRESSREAIGNMRAMIRSVRAAGAVPILGTIPPLCCNVEGLHPPSATLAYNGELRAVAASEGVMLADFYGAFAGGPRAPYDPSRGLIHAPEGVHPTPAGYDAMAEMALRLFSIR